MEKNKQIYIDCDGVIIDTNDIVDEMFYKKFKMLPQNTSLPKDVIIDFFYNLDWEELLPKCQEINNSFENIKKLNQLGLVRGVLTHCSSEKEKVFKKLYFSERLPGIDIICVPKKIPKNKYVDTENKILIDDYIPNLLEWIKDGGVGIKFSSTLSNDDKYVYYEENTSVGQRIYLIDRVRSLEELLPNNNNLKLIRKK